MTLKELDMQNKVYGDVPESFQRRVQYALRQTQEEQPMKQFTLRTAALVLVLVAIAGIAFAAIASNTADYFGKYYGEEWKNAALKGDIDSSKPSVQVGDLIYTMDDVIVTGIQLGGSDGNEGFAVHDDMCSYLLATGTIKPAPGANVVLMCEDYLVSDPWNFNPYYNGRENIPAGTPTVLEKAAETGATILCARTTANGLLDANGEIIPCDIGYNGLVQEDGTLLFTMEIIPLEPLPRQDAYTLSVYVANHEVTAADEHLMDTRQAQDWVFDIHPQKAQNETSTSQSESSSVVSNALYANWDEAVKPLLNQPVSVTVADPVTGSLWQMQAVASENGNYADAKLLSDADTEAMVAAFGNTLDPNAVYVTFPDGQTFLGTLGSWGYAPEQNMVDETGVGIENEKVAYIHFPRSAQDLDPDGYASAHQAALALAWEQLQKD